MSNRHHASVRKIKTLPDFGWTEHHMFFNSAIHYWYELNGCTARTGLVWSVTRPNDEPRKFSTTGKSFAQVYQKMTDYALGKED